MEPTIPFKLMIQHRNFHENQIAKESGNSASISEQNHLFDHFPTCHYKDDCLNGAAESKTIMADDLKTLTARNTDLDNDRPALAGCGSTLLQKLTVIIQNM
jgi:hypothetical protein